MSNYYRLSVVISCIFVLVIIPFSESTVYRGPRMRVITRQTKADTLMLPSNATSIRENITDNFSCEDKMYGYYADVENECQIFHVCYPVMSPGGKNQTFKWSFICPDETIFDQSVFVCVREQDSGVNCDEAEDFYSLNEAFADREIEEELDINADSESTTKREEEIKKRRKPVKMENKKTTESRKKGKM